MSVDVATMRPPPFCRLTPTTALPPGLPLAALRLSAVSPLVGVAVGLGGIDVGVSVATALPTLITPLLPATVTSLPSASEPPGVFEESVLKAVRQYQFKRDGTRYKADQEIVFRIDD